MNTFISQSIIIILFSVLALAPASASVSVTYDQSITDSTIWSEGSGKSPDTTSVSHGKPHKSKTGGPLFTTS